MKIDLRFWSAFSAGSVFVTAIVDALLGHYGTGLALIILGGMSVYNYDSIKAMEERANEIHRTDDFQ